jgi:hypothetical protein
VGNFYNPRKPETGLALYYKGNDKELDYPDHRMVWDVERIKQAKAAIEGRPQRSSSEPRRVVKKSSEMLNYYYHNASDMEDFFRTAFSDKSTPDGILIRLYKDTTMDFPAYICKSTSGGDMHRWAISNKEAFDYAMDKALALMGL